MPASVPAGEVPPEFEDQNQLLDTIMSLHWAKGRDMSDPQEAAQWQWTIRTWDPTLARQEQPDLPMHR